MARMAKWALILALQLGSVAPVFARDEHEDAAAAGEEGDHDGGHHGGPIHLKDVFGSTEFWGAVINFTLLVLLLRRLGGKPLRSFLVNRRREMEREMSIAAEMKAKAEAKYQEYSQRLAQLDQELAKMRRDIEAGAQEDKQRILAEADETSRRLRRETESLIDQHSKALSASIRREMVGAAMAQAERLLRDSITEADQQRLAQSFVREVREEDAGNQPASRRAVAAVPQEQS
jgi:F-type H+-transporting ATPase subunit b